MDVDYINSTFTTLDDLTNVSDKIGELKQLQSQVKEIAESKAAAPTSNEQVLITKINHEKLDQAISQLTTDIKQLETVDNENVVDIINLIIEDHGELPVLVDLKGQYETRIETERTIEKLKQWKSIQQKLNDGVSLVDLKSVSDLISSLDEVNQDLTNFKETLKESKWLSDKSISNQALTSISKQFEDLVFLQSINSTPIYPDTWWGLELLLEPIITRFNYHFTTPNKDTNKLSKPEWAFDFLENFLLDNLALLQIIVDDTFRPLQKIGTYEIITCLLIPLRKKVEKMIEVIDSRVLSAEGAVSIEKNGRLLSHLIFELSSFDQRIKEKYKYNPYIKCFDTVPERKWLGITSDILLNDDNNAVKNWLDFENQLAVKRFNNEIINSKDSFRIDYDYQGTDHQVSLHILRPTYSAYGLVKLINNLNSHFQTLSIVKYQLQYVSRIQLSLIDRYLEIINSQFKIFNDKYNLKNMLNMIPGSMADDSTKGANTTEHLINGLTMLTEIFCSAKFICNALETWSDQLIFIQLWKTYTGLTLDITQDKSIFDSAISQYDELLNKVNKSYEEFFRSEIKQLLKVYVNSSQWELATSGDDDSSPSIHLSSLVNTLPEYLSVLHKSLSNLDYFIVTDKIVTILCDILFEYVLTNNEFNRAGISQFVIDFEYIIKVLQHHLHFNTEEGVDYSNDLNPNYVRIAQAVDLMDSVDPDIVRRYKKMEKKLDAKFLNDLRLKYQHELKELSNYDLNNLLIRINHTS
ncbi:Protein transport protein tip20 [Candida viswanathii]|uniref:Protein transport protein tip20 n=1 Tax=Candida viswanathii TaxID=5486 RepID=A0A367YHF0_9ASCO|nr:Protein transport protein tip20 [Candida viswanathii]